MFDIRHYKVHPDGRVSVITEEGRTRPATDGEWIALWLRDPRITLATVHP